MAPTGTFKCSYELLVKYGTSNIPNGWNISRVLRPNEHTIDTNTSVFQYDGTQKSIKVSATSGGIDLTK